MVQEFASVPVRYSKKWVAASRAPAFAQLLSKIGKSNAASRESAWSRGPTPPLQLSFAPIHPVLQTRSFLAGLRGDSSSSVPS